MSQGYVMRNAVMPITTHNEDETTWTHCIFVDKKGLKAIRRLQRMGLEIHHMSLDLQLITLCIALVALSDHFLFVFEEVKPDGMMAWIIPLMCALIDIVICILIACLDSNERRKIYCCTCLILFGFILVSCVRWFLVYMAMQREELLDKMADILKGKPDEDPLQMIERNNVSAQ